MTDLTNVWPSWGEIGELPPIGFFYERGDRPNEKHLDALWNNLNTEWQELIDGVAARTTDLSGDVVLDGGLVTTAGSGTNVNVSSSADGAYVDGQKTGSVNAETVSLSSNGTGSTRTDTIQLSKDGIVNANEGSTSASGTRMKLAEVDVSTSNTITAVRDFTNRNVEVYSQEETPQDPATGSGFWLDTSSDTVKFFNSSTSSWERLPNLDDLYTDEQAQDTIAAALTAGNDINITYDDAANTITIDSTLQTFSEEEVEDIVATALTAGNDINITYNDAANTITIDSTLQTLSEEEVEDIVAGFVQSDSNLSWSYNDTNNILSISLSDSISVNTLNTTGTFTDPNGTNHTGELADIDDVSTLVDFATVNDLSLPANSRKLKYVQSIQAPVIPIDSDFARYKNIITGDIEINYYLEDFRSTIINDYQYTQISGGSNGFSIEDGSTINVSPQTASENLLIYNSGVASLSTLYKTNVGISRGDNFGLYYYPDGSNKPMVTFDIFSDGNTSYHIGMDGNDNDMKIFKNYDQNNVLDSYPFSQFGSWYYMEVNTTVSDISVTLYDSDAKNNILATLSTTDTDNTSDGYGFSCNNGGGSLTQAAWSGLVKNGSPL